jgi:hypothetical protein
MSDAVANYKVRAADLPACVWWGSIATSASQITEDTGPLISIGRA